MTELTAEAEKFADALIEAGFDPAVADEAAEVFDTIAECGRARGAVDGVREALLTIADTRTGKTPEFRALLYIFSHGRTLREIADEAGLSNESVHYHVKKLRESVPFFSKLAL